MGWHVKMTRVRDTSVRHLQAGGPSMAGTIRYSREFDTEADAQREADAWSASGEFAHYAPSDFTASVEPGAPPPERAHWQSVHTVRA